MTLVERLILILSVMLQLFNPQPPKAVHAEIDREVESATLWLDAHTNSAKNKYGIGPKTKADTNALYCFVRFAMLAKQYS